MGSREIGGLPNGYQAISPPEKSGNNNNHTQSKRTASGGNNGKKCRGKGRGSDFRGKCGRKTTRSDQSYNCTGKYKGNGRSWARGDGYSNWSGCSGQRSNFKKFKGTAALNMNAGSYGHNLSFDYSQQEHNLSFDYSQQEHNSSFDGLQQENRQFNSETPPERNINIVPLTVPVRTRIRSPASPQPAEIMSSETVNIQTAAAKSKEDSKKSSSSSSSSDSEDNVIRSLERAVDDSLLFSKKTVQEAQSTSEPAVNIKKEPLVKKRQSSSSSSESDSSSSSSSVEEIVKEQQLSEEDVICLEDVEKIENLEEKCLLCDKSGHISFHCQMICKNCNAKYHGLKECPKPANLSVVFSNFMQFCLKQSYKYNPNLEFTVDESEQYIAPSTSHPPHSTTSTLSDSRTNDQLKRKKSRSGTPRSSRKRISKSESSDSDSDATSSHRRKRRQNKNFNAQHFNGAIAYPAAFNPSFGFNPPGMINPLLALSHMMGYNPAIGFPRHDPKD